MFSLWNFFLTRRAFTILVMISLVLAGTFAIVRMPKESAPEVVIPIGMVTTALPGATAADVERLITDALEPAIRNVANIKKVTSSSRQGVSMITAEFTAHSDVDSDIQELRNAVERTKHALPSDATSPTITKVDFQNQPILMIGVGTDLDPVTLTELGKELTDALSTVDGVSRVEISGTRPRQISVIARTDALALHNVRAEQILGALVGANASAPVGALTIDDITYPVQFEGNITDTTVIGTLPLTTPSGVITLSDVATIIDGFAAPSSISRIKVEGKEAQFALTLNIYKSAGGNILSVSDGVKQKLSALQNTLLAGSSAVVMYDAADEVRTSISDLTASGTQTIILVMLVLFIAVGFREALIAALAIPFSFMVAFIGMLVTGNSINFLSLFSLIIAIGILVDSGIVVVEGIHTARARGLSKLKAAQTTLKNFSWPLIAGTMTTVAVFIPLFFLSGIIGEFIKSIPFTITVVLIASIAVALGFVPLMTSMIVGEQTSRFARYREALWHTLENWYRRNVRKVLEIKRVRRLFYGLLAFSFIGALALPATGILKVTMFPQNDVDLFYVSIELPHASTLAATDKVAKHVEAIIAGTPYLASYTTTVGSTSVFDGGGMSASSGTKYANITVNLRKDRDRTSMDITAALRKKITSVDFGNAKVSVTNASDSPPTGAPIVVRVWSNDTDSLAQTTEEIENVVRAADGTRDITSSLASDGTELQINVDRARASEYGLSAASVASTLRTAIAGVEATTLRVDGDDISVRVSFDLNREFVNPEDTVFATADSIAMIPITTPRGTIPLGSLISIRANRTSAVISHEDGVRIGTVSAYVHDDANVQDVTDAIRAEAEKLTLQSDAHLTFGGDDEEIKKTFTEMLLALGAGLALMFGILVLEFNTFGTSFRLLSAIPLSLTGVLWGLALVDQPFSFTAFLGIIALAGVVINHGILLLDSINTHRAKDPTIAPLDFILTSATGRLRPIILTTLTTVVGMIPLVFVSDMWAPLALTIAFGLMYSTVLTLIYIPVRSYMYEKKRAR